VEKEREELKEKVQRLEEQVKEMSTPTITEGGEPKNLE
jgi:hypothetical protein